MRPRWLPEVSEFERTYPLSQGFEERFEVLRRLHLRCGGISSLHRPLDNICNGFTKISHDIRKPFDCIIQSAYLVCRPKILPTLATSPAT